MKLVLFVEANLYILCCQLSCQNIFDGQKNYNNHPPITARHSETR